jgi:hypothetical protein
MARRQCPWIITIRLCLCIGWCELEDGWYLGRECNCGIYCIPVLRIWYFFLQTRIKIWIRIRIRIRTDPDTTKISKFRQNYFISQQTHKMKSTQTTCSVRLFDFIWRNYSLSFFLEKRIRQLFTTLELCIKILKDAGWRVVTVQCTVTTRVQCTHRED